MSTATVTHNGPAEHVAGAQRMRVPPGRVAHFTRAERAARGKAARADVPRSSHGEWEPRRTGAIRSRCSRSRPQTRVPELVPIRTAACWCRRSRSTAAPPYLMAADLAGSPRTGLHVQLCGDAHLSNFGVFAAPDRRLVFSLNDFDETLPGPFEWDVKRLVASFAVAGRDRGFDARSSGRRSSWPSARPIARRCAEFAQMGALDVWYARLDVEDLAKQLERRRRPPSSSSASSATSPRRAPRTACGPSDKLTQLVDGRRGSSATRR